MARDPCYSTKRLCTNQVNKVPDTFSSPSDFIVDSLFAWWERQSPDARDGCSLLQIKADNGPESNGRRTQFLKRMVAFADHTATPIQLLYYPPYHSKYNPVERCWGILEKHWNGA